MECNTCTVTLKHYQKHYQEQCISNSTCIEDTLHTRHGNTTTLTFVGLTTVALQNDTYLSASHPNNHSTCHSFPPFVQQLDLTQWSLIVHTSRCKHSQVVIDVSNRQRSLSGFYVFLILSLARLLWKRTACPDRLIQQAGPRPWFGISVNSVWPCILQQALFHTKGWPSAIHASYKGTSCNFQNLPCTVAESSKNKKTVFQ
ncbi:uncharacterized protein LOC144866904 [Branchiostoma floridae x Branchiostoma japonicum]